MRKLQVLKERYHIIILTYNYIQLSLFCRRTIIRIKRNTQFNCMFVHVTFLFFFITIPLSFGEGEVVQYVALCIKDCCVKMVVSNHDS